MSNDNMNAAYKKACANKGTGGVRKLGIPTVMERVIQQAVVQVISPVCEPLFSEYSYVFRP